MADFYLAKGDLAPSLQVQLIGPDGSTPVDLTGGSALFRMQPKGKSEPVFGGACAIVGAATLGILRYDWAVGDTDTQGQFDAEIIVTLASGKTMTLPNKGYFLVEIKLRLV